MLYRSKGRSAQHHSSAHVSSLTTCCPSFLGSSFVTLQCLFYFKIFKATLLSANFKCKNVALMSVYQMAVYLEKKRRSITKIGKCKFSCFVAAVNQI